MTESLSNQKLHVAVERRADATYVTLVGVLDEDSTLGPVAAQIPAGKLLVDLRQVERVSSGGVKAWVTWIAQVASQGAQPHLVDCSPAVVTRMNLVEAFSDRAAIDSFFAPYFCTKCDAEKLLRLEVARLEPPPYQAPPCRCDECKGIMDFDDNEEQYFAFLSRRSAGGG